MKICFFTQSCSPFDGRSLDSVPMSGTEVCIASLASALAQNGHDVVVFSGADNPPPSVPRYLPYAAVPEAGAFDIFVAVRDWTPLLLGMEAREQHYLSFDPPDHVATYGLGDPRVVGRCKLILCASAWQADQLSRMSGVPRERFAVIGAGVWPDWFAPPAERNSFRLISPAVPFAGIDLLCALYRRILEFEPRAELVLVQSPEAIGGISLEHPGAVEHIRRSMLELQQLPRCSLSLPLVRSELARHYLQANISLFPYACDDSAALEVVEAMCGGAVPIASAKGALPERIGMSGIVVQGGDEQLLAGMCAAVKTLLSDSVQLAELRSAAMGRALSSSWTEVAKKFVEAAGAARSS